MLQRIQAPGHALGVEEHDQHQRERNVLKDRTVQQYDPHDDTAIATKVKAALLDDSGLKSFNISVTSSKDVVQLSGVVNSDHGRARATEVAAGIAGVRGVVNNLAVQQACIASGPSPARTATGTQDLGHWVKPFGGGIGHGRPHAADAFASGHRNLGATGASATAFPYRACGALPIR
jgi:hypothetical protein